MTKLGHFKQWREDFQHNRTVKSTDQIFVARKHDERFVDDSIDVGQVLDSHVLNAFGLKFLSNK